MAGVSGASILKCENDTLTRVYKEYSESMKKSPIILSLEAEFAFGWNILNLRLIGLWPEQNGADRLTTKFLLLLWCSVYFTFILAPETLALIIPTLDTNDLIEVINAVCSSILGMIKFLIVWFNGEVFAQCVAFVCDDWTRKITTKEREMMIKNAVFGRKISIGNTIFVQSLVFSYVNIKTVPLLYFIFNAQNATNVKYLFYPGYFPCDINDLSNLAFITCGQCVGSVCWGLANTGTDGLIATLIVHLCGQIAVLRHNIVNLIENDGPINCEMFRAKFRNIVKRHHALIRVGAMIDDSIYVMLLILIISCTVQLCCQLFRLIGVITERIPGQLAYLQVVFNISLISATFIHLLLYCFLGEILINESMSLEMASYSCKWYNLSGRKANDLMLIMKRAEVPMQIWAGKFVPFSLELFGNALKTSLSYFSVLLTMKEKLAN